MAADPAVGGGLVVCLAFGQPIKHGPLLLGVRLLLVLRGHLCRDEVFEHQGSVKRAGVKQLGHVDVSFLNVFVVAI